MTRDGKIDDLIDALRAERNRAVMERDEWESNYLAEMRDHDRTKQLLRHSQRVAGKAIQRGVDTRPPPRPIPGVPENARRPCLRRWCRGREPHSMLAHWFGWMRS